jgi:hypothetical protein
MGCLSGEAADVQREIWILQQLQKEEMDELGCNA